MRWKTSNDVPLRAAVLVDRHGGKASGIRRLPWRETQGARLGAPRGSDARRGSRALVRARRRRVHAAAAAFLSTPLTAWPPHEDETLRALRRPASARRAASDRARRARRRAAALCVRVGGRAPRSWPRRRCGPCRPFFAVASLPLLAAARSRGWPDGVHGARRDRARLRELDAALPRRLRTDVQPLPVHEPALVPRAAPRDRARRPRALGAVGRSRSSLCVAAHPYGALVLASKRSTSPSRV